MHLERIPEGCSAMCVVRHRANVMLQQVEGPDEKGDAHERQPLLKPDVLGSTNAPINDAATASPEQSSSASRGGSTALFIRGLLLAVLVGLCGGSTLVPIKFSPVRNEVAVLRAYNTLSIH